MTGIAYQRHKRKPAPKAGVHMPDATPTLDRTPHAVAMPTNYPNWFCLVIHLLVQLAPGALCQYKQLTTS
jgi:hypothetical protein